MDFILWFTAGILVGAIALPFLVFALVLATSGKHELEVDKRVSELLCSGLPPEG